jgi:4-hydroxy-3-polyprenylbenzoate decarboxylase
LIGNKIHFIFQMGPADVLDHAAQSFTYGGKLGIDATLKLPEEISLEKNNSENINKINFDISTIQSVLKNLEELKEFNTSLIEEGLDLLFVSINKTRKGQIEELFSAITDKTEFSGIRFILFFDSDISLKNISILTWLALSNIDPIRDCYFKKTENSFVLAIDATRKNYDIDKYQTEWPSIISMDKDTIHEVDEKWSSLGLGEFIPSPSSF